MSSMSFAMGQGLRAAYGREREVGVVLCPNRPSWTDKLIAASACFVTAGEFNGNTERQTFHSTR